MRRPRMLAIAGVVALVPGVARAAAPPPTAVGCALTWNASPPLLPAGVQAPRPTLVQALGADTFVSTWDAAGSKTITGPACAVSIVERSGKALVVFGGWRGGLATSWGRPLVSTGLIAGTIPNATLGADGHVTLAPVKLDLPPLGRTRVREIGSTGWAGGLRPYGSLADAIARFGKPSSEVRSGIGCRVSWTSVAVQGLFLAGIDKGPPRRIVECSGSGTAVSMTAGGSWRTPQGLRVGAPVADLTRLYPGATHAPIPGGATTWYLVPRRPSADSKGLTAVVVAGRVRALTTSTGLVAGIDAG